MKIVYIFLFTLFGITGLQAQKIKKDTFEVSGVCKMCEKRIENAALIRGVKMAEWDKHSQTVTVIYNTKKTCVEDIHKAIAEAGHDTAQEKAPDETYSALPACCAYRDGIEVH